LALHISSGSSFLRTILSRDDLPPQPPSSPAARLPSHLPPRPPGSSPVSAERPRGYRGRVRVEGGPELSGSLELSGGLELLEGALGLEGGLLKEPWVRARRSPTTNDPERKNSLSSFQPGLHLRLRGSGVEKPIFRRGPSDIDLSMGPSRRVLLPPGRLCDHASAITPLRSNDLCHQARAIRQGPSGKERNKSRYWPIRGSSIQLSGQWQPVFSGAGFETLSVSGPS
jgi:hypothetical protein